MKIISMPYSRSDYIANELGDITLCNPLATMEGRDGTYRLQSVQFQNSGCGDPVTMYTVYNPQRERVVVVSTDDGFRNKNDWGYGMSEPLAFNEALRLLEKWATR